MQISNFRYDTSVAGMGITLERSAAVSYPPSLVTSRAAMFVRLPQAGEVSAKAFTSEFKVI